MYLNMFTLLFDFAGDKGLPGETSHNNIQSISKAPPNTTGNTRNPPREAKHHTPQGGPATMATAKTGGGTTTRSTLPMTKRCTETPKRLRT